MKLTSKISSAIESRVSNLNNAKTCKIEELNKMQNSTASFNTIQIELLMCSSKIEAYQHCLEIIKFFEKGK